MIISLLIELLIDDENFSLPLCTYVAGFDKSGHIIILKIKDLKLYIGIVKKQINMMLIENTLLF